MDKFRIKEVKNERVSSNGEKASWFYPQVKGSLWFYRNIKPSEMPGDEFSGFVVRFAQLSSAMNFLHRYAEVKGIERKKQEIGVRYHSDETIIHEVKGW